MPDSPSRPRPSDAARESLTPRFTRFFRLVRLLLHLLSGCFYVGVLFPFFSQPARFRAIRRWAGQLLSMLCVKVDVRGALPAGQAPTLIVSNHVSWLDIWVINAVVPVRFVAKSDIRRWPVVGFLVAGSGTIFIERQKKQDTIRTNRAIVQALTRGEHVAMFPEGTTTDGTQVKPFHASLFQPAVGAGARVVVTALRYVSRDGTPNLNAAYSGDRSLWESVCLILSQRTLYAELVFAATIEVLGKTRREVAREAEGLTADALWLPRPDRRPETTADPRAAAPTASSPTGNRYPARSHSAQAPDPTLTSVRR